jgi:adenylate cyclase
VSRDTIGDSVSEPAPVEEQTFFFADLAGFTALTEAMGDESAAELASEFCTDVAGLASDYEAEEIKRIGDAVLLRGADPAQAVRLALRIALDVGGRHGFLNVRVGMHTGLAVERDGDWFGSTVNLAARISAEAASGEVLRTEATRTAAGDIEGVELQECGRRSFKNVTEPPLLYAAVREGERTTAGLPVDPVCRMAVDPEHSAGTLRHEGVAYHFCSLDCARRFAATPARYMPGGKG